VVLVETKGGGHTWPGRDPIVRFLGKSTEDISANDRMWEFFEEHRNVRKDFVRDLIDHAHTRGVRVLLGFTPFGYDGVRRKPQVERGETTHMRVLRIAALAIVAGLGRLATAEPVDLSKPFQVDKDTICLFHLDDVAGGEVRDSVAGGRSGKVKEPMAAQGKFAGALSCDGDKGWADVTDLPKTEGLTALTVECWVKLRGGAAGDVVCRGNQYMIRLSTSVTASFWIDGAWRYVNGNRSVPVDRWTHLAITWDQRKKQVGIYRDGRLDVAETPEGVTDGVLGGGLRMLRLGGHTWQSPAPNLNGLLDEVRVSSVIREYRPLPGSEKNEGAATPGPRRTAGAGRKEAAAQAQATPAKFVFPWGMNADPTDVPKSHVQKITRGTQNWAFAN
jgi:hypothetical protein